jgi:hypothetical protein
MGREAVANGKHSERRRRQSRALRTALALEPPIQARVVSEAEDVYSSKVTHFEAPSADELVRRFSECLGVLNVTSEKVDDVLFIWVQWREKTCTE